jgi:phosphatidylinositol N-acetylglucosaminyltransferase subunit A
MYQLFRYCLTNKVIPAICNKFPEVYFIIGGDGPKKRVIEDVVRKNNLEKRVEMVISLYHIINK